VEVISNAVPNFKEPAAKNAAKTLVMMGSILAVLFTGVTFLAYWYGIAPKAGITKVVEQSLNYAQAIGDYVLAVYVAFDRESMLRMEEKWKKWRPDIRLVTLISYYRDLITPISKLVDTIESKAGERNYTVTVLIPQFIPKKGWHNFLHNQSSVLLRLYLLYKKNVIVSTVPYRLQK
jgi:hypothetical protein